MSQVALIVDATWLASHLSDSGIQVLEIAKSPESYHKAHICGAQLVPYHHYLKAFDESDERTPDLIGETEFRELAHALGLKKDIHYVVYDEEHGLWAARFWAICRHYGVLNVSILDGSWHGWLVQGLPINSQTEIPAPGANVSLAVALDTLITCEQLMETMDNPGFQIWDTRRPAEFDGSEETDNRRHGHVPGAVHLTWSDLLTGQDNPGEARYLKSEAEMGKMLAAIGLQKDHTVVTYCQAGIRAAFCQLMLVRLGYSRTRLYDASMSEWCNREDTPLEK